MKRYTAVILAALMAVCCLSACSSENPQPSQSVEAAPKIQIVTTIFPEYDWVMNVLGDNSKNADVTFLLDSGVDPHSFQPSVEDILKISTCDLFIYVGGESNGWVDEALREAINKNIIVINLLEALGDAAKEEEEAEGMQEEHGHEDEDETEYDEHVWLSLKNAAVLVGKISEALQSVDSANAEAYKSNTAAYTEKLNALDAEYSAAVAAAPVKTLLFGDRFPFRYLTEDYGLAYYAAFAGCSAETEASFETVTFLAGKVDELSLHSVITIDGSDKRLAETIVRNTADKNQQILTLDSMQSKTAKDIAGGTTYLSVMENNLAVLKEALK